MALPCARTSRSPKGDAALRKLWQDDFAMPGMGAWTFTPQRIEIAQSGDLAADQGTAEIVFHSDKGDSTLAVKYLGVWNRVDGQWKVLYDMWNTNAPLK